MRVLRKDHKSRRDFILLWYQNDINKRKKGIHRTTFYVSKSKELEVGDLVFIGQDDVQEKFWQIEEIVSVKDSNMTGKNHVETLASFKTFNK